MQQAQTQQNFDNIPETALGWHRAGDGAILATVVETWGSAPRPVGSQLAISGTGEIAGSVSGGCVEGAVVVEAIDALDKGTPLMLEYGVSDDEAFAVGLACGGRIRVLIEPVGAVLPEELLRDLVAARVARKPVAYCVNTESWARHLEGGDGPNAERFRRDKSGFDGDTFVGIHNPPLRMAVVGAVHIAQPLLVMARLAGFEVGLIDPRPAFGSEQRFPDTMILSNWPDEALTQFGLDSRTAVVTLTHDPKLDDPAIMASLRSKVFYLGCLGSKRTHAKRVDRLTDAGFDGATIARIHAPVGLNIGGQSPAEIAISIMAEVTQTLRQAE